MTLYASIRHALSGQYGAALGMLRVSVLRSNDAVWRGGAMQTWRIAYHALFYTDLYSSGSVDAFRPWSNHMEDYQALGPMIEKGGRLPVISREYGISEVCAYLDELRAVIHDRVNANAIEGVSGFPWLSMSRLDVHLYNMRHLQHHIGQINDRLAGHGLKGSDWIGANWSSVGAS